MKNTINFFYNLNIESVNNYNNYYYFYHNNYYYVFFRYDLDINKIDEIYKLNSFMSNFTYIHQIVLNKNNYPLSNIQGINYILYRVVINNFNNKIDLSSLYKLNIQISNSVLNTNWAVLWEKKVDYLEYQINQMGKKYPLIVESFSYYVGLTENAISYFNDTFNSVNPNDSDVGFISHRKLDNSLFSLYDPCNIIIDYRVRDIAEYIKLSFFEDNFNIYKELEYYFRNNYFSIFSIRILFARLLYPSYYFNIYDGIITNTIKEDSLLKITSRIHEYEIFLYDIYNLLSQYYRIPQIEWLKKAVNLH